MRQAAGVHPAWLRLAALATGLAIAGGVLAWLERRPALAAARRAAAARDLPNSAFPSRDTMLGLRRLGLLSPLPPAASGDGERGYRGYRLALDAPPAEDLARELAIPAEWLARPVSVASLLVDPADLERLRTHPGARGRDWEIPGFFAWLESGRLLFSSPVGVRLHGGWVRRFPEVQGYRLYFRRRQGAARFPAALLPGHPGPDLSRLVLRQDGRVDPWQRYWEWEAPLTCDIARRVGCPAPHARPVLLFLNGHNTGLRAAIEHLSQDYYRDRYGHDRFSIFDTKTSRRQAADHKGGDAGAYRELSAYLYGPEPLTLARVAARVDVDNLARWLATVAFLGTGDRLQGMLARDDSTTPPGKWFWTAWDLDQSFGKGIPPPAPSWELDNFDDARAQQSPDLRAHILRHLPKADPAFAPYFTRLFVEVLNHRLTDGFLVERVAYYRRLTTEYRRGREGEQGMAQLEDFLLRRKPVLRRQLDQHFGAGEAFRLEAVAPAGRRLLVDGYPWTPPYRGWYFASTPAELAIEPQDREAFSHWRIDGRPGPQGEWRLRLELRADSRVEAVFME